MRIQGRGGGATSVSACVLPLEVQNLRDLFPLRYFWRRVHAPGLLGVLDLRRDLGTGTEGWTDGRIVGRTNRQMGGWTEVPWSEGAKPHCDEGRSRSGTPLLLHRTCSRVPLPLPPGHSHAMHDTTVTSIHRLCLHLRKGKGLSK